MLSAVASIPPQQRFSGLYVSTVPTELPVRVGAPSSYVDRCSGDRRPDDASPEWTGLVGGAGPSWS